MVLKEGASLSFRSRIKLNSKVVRVLQMDWDNLQVYKICQDIERWDCE